MAVALETALVGCAHGILQSAIDPNVCWWNETANDCSAVCLDEAAFCPTRAMRTRVELSAFPPLGTLANCDTHAWPKSAKHFLCFGND